MRSAGRKPALTRGVGATPLSARGAGKQGARGRTICSGSEREPKGRLKARPCGGPSSKLEAIGVLVPGGLMRCRSNHCIPEKPGLLLV